MEIKVTRIDATYEGLDALIAGGKMQGKIGWPGDAIHMDPETGNVQPVAYTAIKNEFGYATTTPRGNPAIVPARPFLRNTVSRESTNWLNQMEDGAKKVLDNQYGFDKVLDAVGAQAVQDVIATVFSNPFEPIAELTVKNRIKRGNSHILPLYDTGHMLGTLTNEVESK